MQIWDPNYIHAPGPFLATFSRGVAKGQGRFHSQQHLLSHQNTLGPEGSDHQRLQVFSTQIRCHVGLSENSVPLKPNGSSHMFPMKWL